MFKNVCIDCSYQSTVSNIFATQPKNVMVHLQFTSLPMDLLMIPAV